MSTTSVMIRLRQTLKQNYKLDAISFSLFIFNTILGAFLVVIAANTAEYGIGFKAILMIILTFIGIVGYTTTYGKFPEIDRTLDPKESALIASSSIIGFTFILLLQTSVTAVYRPVFGAIGEIPFRLLLINIAISEEFFFRFFIQSALTLQLSRTMAPILAAPFSILGTSVIFTLFHYVYYGVTQALVAVFVSSLVLGSIYELTRRLSVSQTVHILVNSM